MENVTDPWYLSMKFKKIESVLFLLSPSHKVIQTDTMLTENMLRIHLKLIKLSIL